MNTPEAIQQYLSNLRDEAQSAVQVIRTLIKETAPDAQEGLSYGVGGFSQNGKYFIYYAGYKKHTSIYPASRPHPAFEEELKHYKGGKDTIQFPLNQPIPVDLIQRIVRFRIGENEEK